mmetsp:Transcript_59261/g.139852  ORF Transcript_59261/g.139852 Transcript_59261/m.139852 type:complete len:336 (+) Transcript_59261:2413-3420(+)
MAGLPAVAVKAARGEGLDRGGAAVDREVGAAAHRDVQHARGRVAEQVQRGVPGRVLEAADGVAEAALGRVVDAEVDVIDAGHEAQCVADLMLGHGDEVGLVARHLAVDARVGEAVGEGIRKADAGIRRAGVVDRGQAQGLGIGRRQHELGVVDRTVVVEPGRQVSLGGQKAQRRACLQMADGAEVGGRAGVGGQPAAQRAVVDRRSVGGGRAQHVGAEVAEGDVDVDRDLVGQATGPEIGCGLKAGVLLCAHRGRADIGQHEIDGLGLGRGGHEGQGERKRCGITGTAGGHVGPRNGKAVLGLSAPPVTTCATQLQLFFTDGPQAGPRGCRIWPA